MELRFTLLLISSSELKWPTVAGQESFDKIYINCEERKIMLFYQRKVLNIFVIASHFKIFTLPCC